MMNSKHPPRVSTGADMTRYRRLLTQAEAADYLGVSPRTIRTYIARGILKANRIKGSRLIRIDSAELDAVVRPVIAGWDDHE
jgi:excisionase family DNA binding protein